MKRDVEPFLKRLMVVLLTLRAECSLVTSKPAHLSLYLPLELCQWARAYGGRFAFSSRVAGATSDAAAISSIAALF